MQDIQLEYRARLNTLERQLRAAIEAQARALISTSICYLYQTES